MNSEFRHWLELSGLANKELARRIRARAQSKGLKQVSTEASRVRGWLAGQQPAPDVAEIVAEVLTEACREPLTPAALGFTGGQSKGKQALIDLTGHVSHVAQRLQAHSRSDLLVPEPTNDSTEMPVTGNRLVRPLQRWITAEPEHGNGVGLGRSRISVDDCADLEAVTRMFREWDNRAGGGLRRKAVVAQLSEVLPAAFIGGFSLKRTGKTRERAVWAFYRGQPKLRQTSAEGLGYAHNVYTMSTQQHADILEETWRAYESELPQAIEDLIHSSTRTINADTWLRVLVPFHS